MAKDTENQKIEMFVGEGENRKVRFFSEKNLEKIWPTLSPEDKSDACLYQKMSIEFIKRHADEIDFNKLSTNPNITFGIMEAFADRISWKTICINSKKLSDSFLYNFRLRIDWEAYLQFHQLEAEILVHLAEAFRKSTARDAKKKFWKALSKFQEMDTAFIKAYMRYLDFDMLSVNTHIPESVLQDVLEYLNFTLLLSRTDLSDDFLKKNAKTFVKDENIAKIIKAKTENTNK
jgi:hypothetical protein